MANSQFHRPGPRVPIRVVLLLLILLIGGTGWLIGRVIFADQTATISSVLAAPSAADVPATSPSTETLPQQRTRLGIYLRHLTLSAIPDGLNYSVAIRLIGDRMEIDATQSPAGNHLHVIYTPMPPGGAGGSDQALIRRGVELASRSSGAVERLKIDPSQFYSLVAAAMPGHRPLALITAGPDASADPFAAHMSDFFQKWLASAAAGRKTIEADWLALMQQEGGNQLQQLDSNVAAHFDNCVNALTPEQKIILTDLGKSNPSTQPIVRGWGAAVPLIPGVHVAETLTAASGKLFASWNTNGAAAPFTDFQPRVPTEISAQWIRTDNAISELLRNDKLARQLAITPEQLTQLQTIPARLPSAMSLTDADRQSLINAEADYCASLPADRAARGITLMQAVRDIGDRDYPPYLQRQTSRDTAIASILTPPQLAALAALFKDSVSVK